MSLPKEVHLTKDGGHYYRAMVFHWVFTAVILPVVFAALLIAIINPLWFRNDLFNWMENAINKVARWRNYQKYKIYLGTDPELWHTLKD